MLVSGRVTSTYVLPTRHPTQSGSHRTQSRWTNWICKKKSSHMPLNNGALMQRLQTQGFCSPCNEQWSWPIFAFERVQLKAAGICHEKTTHVTVTKPKQCILATLSSFTSQTPMSLVDLSSAVAMTENLDKGTCGQQDAAITRNFCWMSRVETLTMHVCHDHFW